MGGKVEGKRSVAEMAQRPLRASRNFQFVRASQRRAARNAATNAATPETSEFLTTVRVLTTRSVAISRETYGRGPSRLVSKNNSVARERMAAAASASGTGAFAGARAPLRRGSRENGRESTGQKREYAYTRWQCKRTSL